VFTRLLIGLDGSPQADAALEQAVVLGQRFGATLVVAHVLEPSATDADGAMLERARERAAAAALKIETIERDGDPALALAELAKDVDAVLVGRRGQTRGKEAIGATVATLIRVSERCVVVSGGVPSPMRVCAVAFDGGETSRRALDLAARFATVVGSTVHVIHANADHAAGLQVVGQAEAALSLLAVPFVTHVEPGEPGEVVAAVVRQTRCDALFAGAHVPRHGERPSAVVSHSEEILRHTDIPVVIQP
jgi:nucleotide-binding universal stress UspA family protein